MLVPRWRPALRARSSWRRGAPFGASRQQLHAAAAVHGRRRTGAHRTVAKPSSADAEVVTRLQTALPDVDVTLGMDGACPGCGVALQSHAPSGWGYVPAARAAADGLADGDTDADTGASQPTSAGDVLCQRCHRLRHHNDSDVRQMTALQARRQMETALGHRRCIVVVVVDLLDFHGSFVPGLAKDIGGQRPVIIAANKVDLLPPSAHKVRLEQWVWRESRKLYAHPSNIKSVHLVSSVMQQGLPALLDSMRSEALRYGARDGTPAEVVVVGATNAGKSTLLNAISTTLEEDPLLTKKKIKANKFKRKGDGSRGAAAGRLTESLTPGTTLRCIPMALTPRLDERQQLQALSGGAGFGGGSGFGGGGIGGAPRPLMLLDTPGQIIPTSISSTAQLSIADQRLLHPKRPMTPTAIELLPGKALLLGGLAMVEHTGGAPVVARVFVAEGVTVHSTDMSRAEEVRQRHCGVLLTPPTAPAADAEGEGAAGGGEGGRTGDLLDSEAVLDALALEAQLAELELELKLEDEEVVEVDGDYNEEEGDFMGFEDTEEIDR